MRFLCISHPDPNSASAHARPSPSLPSLSRAAQRSTSHRVASGGQQPAAGRSCLSSSRKRLAGGVFRSTRFCTPGPSPSFQLTTTAAVRYSWPSLPSYFGGCNIKSSGRGARSTRATPWLSPCDVDGAAGLASRASDRKVLQPCGSIGKQSVSKRRTRGDARKHHDSRRHVPLCHRMNSCPFRRLAESGSALGGLSHPSPKTSELSFSFPSATGRLAGPYSDLQASLPLLF